MKASELVQKLNHEQAEDEGLWFESKTASEAYLQQELRKLHDAIESLLQAQGEVEDWIPTSERIPENGEMVLIWFPDVYGHIRFGYWEDGKLDFAQCAGESMAEATHWKPIKPPRTKDKKEGENV